VNYLRDHWQGDHSLFRSFWLNLIAVRAVILGLERLTYPPFIEPSTAAIWISVIFVAVFHGVVFGWQIVGVVRAVDRDQRAHGSIATAFSAHFGIAFTVLVSTVVVFSAFQELTKSRPKAKVVRPDPLGPYTFSLNGNGTIIYLHGDFRIGITKALGAFINQHPAVTGIVLNSAGGNIFQGRGVAKLIRSHGLNTYVIETCRSTCTTAFIAGRKRFLGTGATLGFHQYGIDTNINSLLPDPRAEQETDLTSYAEQGVTATFRQNVFDAPHDKIWLPGADELIAGGVVHEILPKNFRP